MTDKTEAQPEALRLADRLDCDASDSDMGRKPVACTRRKAAAELRRLHAELQQHNAQLADETESASEWRRLALQFDGHRMQALSHLRLLTKHPGDHCAAAVNFLASPPLSGEQVLADRLAQLSARQAAPDGLTQLLQSLLQESCMPEGETYLSNEHYRKIHEFLQSPPPPEREPLTPDSSDVVTDEEMQSAFAGTNFGTKAYRHLLHQALLKKACEYHCGHTITQIMKELGLIGVTGRPLQKGIKMLRIAYREQMMEGP